MESDIGSKWRARAISFPLFCCYTIAEKQKEGKAMLDRLHHLLPHLERLPDESQEEVLAYIEVLIEALENSAVARGHLKSPLPDLPADEPWIDPVGAWSDLPETLLDDLERTRHATPPTPPIDEL